MYALSSVRITAVMVGYLTLPAGALAQPLPSPSSPPAIAVQQTEGTVKHIDPSSNTLTLADGTEFIVPERLMTGARNDLTPGIPVKVSFQQEGGRKVVTQFEIVR